MLPGDLEVEFNERTDEFRIVGTDGVRTFPYSKLKTFRPSAITSPDGILAWERHFKRRGTSNVEPD
jgi:hypothetical protein